MKRHPERLTRAYERMLERSKGLYTDAGHTVQRAIQTAAETASELGELTREEAERIGLYLQRDVQDAAAFLSKHGGELRDWLRFDAELIEDRVLDALSLLVDNTKLELSAWALGANEWHTGEVTGPGTLVCAACGEELHFKQAGHIPPCPKCHGSRYRRDRG
jgi:hypothetical protein